MTTFSPNRLLLRSGDFIVPTKSNVVSPIDSFGVSEYSVNGNPLPSQNEFKLISENMDSSSESHSFSSPNK